MKLLTLAPIAVVLLSGTLAQAEDVGGCGQTVSSGVLTADLNCPAGDCAVSIVHGGSLDLAGHTITTDGDCAISCQRDCSIDGNGGSVINSGVYGIHSPHKNARVNVSDVSVVGGNFAILGARVVVSDASVSGAGVGVTGTRSLEVRDSELTENSDAVNADRHATIENTTLTDNDRGARVDRKLTATNVTATDNGYAGLVARKILASMSTITGNGGNPACSSEEFGCLDLLSSSRPLLDAAACDRSGRIDRDGVVVDGTWSVCTLD